MARAWRLTFCAIAACSDPQPEAPPRKPPLTVADKPILADAAVDAGPPVDPIFAQLAARTGSYAPVDAKVDLVPYRDRDKWGYADRTLTVVIEPRYTAAPPFRGGRAIVSQPGGCGMIDSAGTEVTPLTFESCLSLGTYAALRVPGGWLVVDAKGKPINQVLYDRVLEADAAEGVIGVVHKDAIGFVATDGGLRVGFQYAAVLAPGDGLIPVRDETKNYWGAIDFFGKVTIPFEYDEVGPFRKGLSVARQGPNWGVIDRTGKAIIGFDHPAIAEGADDFVVHAGKPPSLVLDRTGMQIGKLPVVVVGPFADGLAAFRRGTKIGFVDRTGKTVVPPRYEAAGEFRDGVAVVKLKGRFGLIDRTGKTVVPPKYDELAALENGIWVVRDARSGSPRFYIDRAGQEYMSRETRDLLRPPGDL